MWPFLRLCLVFAPCFLEIVMGLRSSKARHVFWEARAYLLVKFFHSNKYYFVAMRCSEANKTSGMSGEFGHLHLAEILLDLRHYYVSILGCIEQIKFIFNAIFF